MKSLAAVRKKKESGFTIAEVIIASVIFVLSVAGIYASISALRQPASESSREVTAAFIGKRILDDLRTQVSASTWSGGPLDPAGSPYTMNSVTINGIVYTPVYTVVADPNGTNARKVTLNITW